MSSNSPLKNPLTADRQGFTLLEVLISMAVLIFISLAIYNAVTQTFKLRDVLSYEGDFYNSIRLSMTVLQRDVEMIYSPTIGMPGGATGTAANPAANGLPPAYGSSTPGNPPNSAQAQLSSGELAQNLTFWGPALDVNGLRPSRFQGTATSLSFVSASHLRIYKESPETEFAKVTYSLASDDTVKEGGAAASILLKTESPNVFEEDDRKDKYVQSYKLLYGIKSLKFRYYRKDKDKWVDSWDSVSLDTKNLYPDRIEVRLEVTGPERLSFEGTYFFRPEVPLRGLSPST